MESPAKFISQVRAEVGKIAWPTRREVITTTIMVLVMASLASVFFFLVDLGIKTGLARLLGFVGG
ncbi:preprotein translocase subunit SecE [Paracoccus mangrovi]|mgnify:CR=1 FL=1|jgi:preprotein translocase subunit SecE|uniref:Protein translocase subunit SecE n=1 Tax=Paracoccus mangrovi TaxID=1715645 RepID=A0ABV7R6Y8_9RHOB